MLDRELEASPCNIPVWCTSTRGTLAAIRSFLFSPSHGRREPPTVSIFIEFTDYRLVLKTNVGARQSEKTDGILSRRDETHSKKKCIMYNLLMRTGKRLSEPAAGSRWFVPAHTSSFIQAGTSIWILQGLFFFSFFFPGGRHSALSSAAMWRENIQGKHFTHVTCTRTRTPLPSDVSNICPLFSLKVKWEFKSNGGNKPKLLVFTLKKKRKKLCVQSSGNATCLPRWQPLIVSRFGQKCQYCKKLKQK